MNKNPHTAKITIVGAGFSGLTLAHYLNKLGVPCEVIEKSARAGGLLGTIHHPLGLVEQAANGLIANGLVEELGRDLNLELIETKKASKKRFIYFNKPTRWPIGVVDSLLVFVRVLQFLIFRGLGMTPRPLETVAKYVERIGSRRILQQLIAPALQGIYAGDVEKMSARLIFGRLFNDIHPDPIKIKHLPTRAKLRGTVAPLGGMGALTEALHQSLLRRGVPIYLNASQELIQSRLQDHADSQRGLVLAVGLESASELLNQLSDQFSLSQQIRKLLEPVETLPLVSVTVFFDRQAARLPGFGCLFAPSEGFSSLGVLFNAFIFEGRAQEHSETWILGGALRPEIVIQTDTDLLSAICTDRERLFKAKDEIKGFEITRWPSALPHYTVDLEAALVALSNMKESAVDHHRLSNHQEDNVSPQTFWLHGNYMGRLGLSQILARSQALAEEIRSQQESTIKK